ncbi:hypothetical protein [Streptomyces humicola]|nr:hypothetical protein [Streptomyces humicola]
MNIHSARAVAGSCTTARELVRTMAFTPYGRRSHRRQPRAEAR